MPNFAIDLSAGYGTDGTFAPRRKRRLAPRLLTAVAVLASTLVGGAAPAAATETVVRLAGTNRVETSTVVAQAGWTSAERILLATSRDYPDAVAASAYASMLDAPLLLTDPKTLSPEVAETIDALGVARVTILGGPGAISNDVEDSLKSLGLTVDRVAGKSRFETAAALADQVDRRGSVDVVAVALGDRTDGRDAWPDALAAASLAGLASPIPTLLTRRNVLPQETAMAIERLGASKVILLGGEGAINAAVEKSITDLGVEVERVEGDNRYETGVAVARKAMNRADDEHGSLSPDQAVFVSGESFADALGAGALAAKLGAPLLLVPGGILANEVDAFIRSDATDFAGAVIVGGPGAVAPFVADELQAAIDGTARPEPPPPAPSCPENSSPDCQYTYNHPIETWENLAECESHQQWDINTGNGYYGGLQFSHGTWQNVGGAGYAHQNTKWEQIYRGEILQERSGWGQWPHCSKKLGLR
ncbi:MAG: putative cell wall-binding protein [Glaciecola sp.]